MSEASTDIERALRDVSNSVLFQTLNVLVNSIEPDDRKAATAKVDGWGVTFEEAYSELDRRMVMKGAEPLSPPSSAKLEYVCDRHRHLVCVPYSIENLHRMAHDLGIKRCWFHLTHFDIPKRRVEEVTARCRVVSPRNIVRIIRGETEGSEG